MIQPRWDILGLGCVTVDDLLYLPEYPAPDSKMQISGSERQGGGLTGTALVAAARLGTHCAFAGVMGNDDVSNWILNDLKQEGLDVSQAVRRADARPFRATILVESQGHTRTILYDAPEMSGADDELPTDDVIRSTRVLFVDDFGIVGQLRAARIAHDAGIPIVGDFERVTTPRVADLITLVDHLIVSIRFASALTALSDPAEAARKLWHEHSSVVVITGGAQGCWVTENGQDVTHFPAFKVEVVDTTGCGDVFHGAYAAALTWDMPLPERIRFASASAALKATQAGGRRGIPTREIVEIFLKK